jgi:hypothetical protein
MTNKKQSMYEFIKEISPLVEGSDSFPDWMLREFCDCIDSLDKNKNFIYMNSKSFTTLPPRNFNKHHVSTSPKPSNSLLIIDDPTLTPDY